MVAENPYQAPPSEHDADAVARRAGRWKRALPVLALGCLLYLLRVVIWGPGAL